MGSLTNNGLYEDNTPVSGGSAGIGIVNNGVLSTVARLKITSSGAHGGFTKGADYSITNSGTLTLPHGVISANSDNTGRGRELPAQRRRRQRHHRQHPQHRHAAVGYLQQPRAAGMLGKGQFFGGVQSSGKVVDYQALDASLFHAHPPEGKQ